MRTRLSVESAANSSAWVSAVWVVFTGDAL